MPRLERNVAGVTENVKPVKGRRSRILDACGDGGGGQKGIEPLSRLLSMMCRKFTSTVSWSKKIQFN